MSYQLSSYVKKHLLIEIRQNFLPRTYAKSDGIISIHLQTCKTNTSPKNDRKFTYKRPNPINGISSKTYRSTESKDIEKL